MKDAAYREKRAERRIRDRERVFSKTVRVAAQVYPGPDSHPRVWYAWKDAAGAEHYGHLDTWGDVFGVRESYARHNYKNRARCSCHMCGNPRRFFGEVTYQEKKAALSAREQVAEEGLSFRKR